VRVDARTALDEVNDLLHADLPEGDWDTIGGLLYGRLGHVPVEGESVQVDGWQLTAQRIQGRRIGRVRIVPASAPIGAARSTEGAAGDMEGAVTRTAQAERPHTAAPANDRPPNGQ
jgi:Mg2+/Co2+ transporter CorC